MMAVTSVVETFELIRSFPTLAPFAELYSPEDFNTSSDFSMKFAEWSVGPWSGSGSIQAARFVLAVWNGHTPDDGGWWNDEEMVECPVGRFDPVAAVAVWDDAHRNAFLAWCENPFWP